MSRFRIHDPIFSIVNSRSIRRQLSSQFVGFIAGIVFCLLIIPLFRICKDYAQSSHNVFIYKNISQIPSDFGTIGHPIIHANYSYDRFSPFIFIGGFPRSGTTLMRAMLDAHEHVRCGKETHVIPDILFEVSKWLSKKMRRKLFRAGITRKVLSNAVAAFALEVIVNHGEPAKRLCNKDPLIMSYAYYVIHELYPKAKIIYMIRDGRASISSIFKRNVTVASLDRNNPRQNLEIWSNMSTRMLNECDLVGPNCLKVRYESLVLRPREQLQRILNFLDLPWSENVMHHEEFVDKPGGIYLSKSEKSTDQVVKPVNTEALSSWVGTFSDDILNDMDKIAPMLATFGYNPAENPPKYDELDPEFNPPYLNEVLKLIGQVL